MQFFAEIASKFTLISAELSAITIISCALGGLGIFLLGMQQISEGLQGVAGPKMRKLVAAATTNRFAGVTTGAVVTAIIQSSSVTTVMVVGMVTSGIMTLTQAINVIIGANIGTTATAWLVASFPKIGITAIAFIIGISALIYLFAKREGWKFVGLIFLGLGLIFFGLDFIKGAMDPIADSQGLRDAMALFSACDATGTFSAWGMIKCIFVGMMATAIVQSSSATTGIAIILVANGSINFYSAATLVLGMNIGTTITAWLAALGAPTNARRAALAHSLFNIIGTVVMAPLFPLCLPIANRIFGIDAMSATSLTFAVAGVHTAFNLINTCLFLPVVTYFANVIMRIIPEPKVHELPRLTVLNPLKLAPVVAVEQARKEVEQMSVRCEAILDGLRTCLVGNVTEEIENDIFHAEEELDILQHEVSHFLGVIMTTNLPSDVANRARMLLRVADELESVSDDVTALMKLFIRMRKANLKLSENIQVELLNLHDMCRTFAQMVCEAFRQGKLHAIDLLNHVHSDANAITVRVKEIRSQQLTRMADHDPTLNPITTVVILDMLNLYRRLKEDCLNIGESMLEEGRA
jgi:phosphate:Na+ symporter